MAAGGRKLPKWHTFCISNFYATKNNSFLDFFYLQFKIPWVKYRYKKKKGFGEKMISDCCGQPVYFQDICPRCGEHCGDSGDDGYDAAVDAYNAGYGPPVTRRQRQEEQDEIDEYRRNGRY